MGYAQLPAMHDKAVTDCQGLISTTDNKLCCPRLGQALACSATAYAALAQVL
jgi:hypothetical protein